VNRLVDAVALTLAVGREDLNIVRDTHMHYVTGCSLETGSSIEGRHLWSFYDHACRWKYQQPITGSHRLFSLASFAAWALTVTVGRADSVPKYG
jgi:hypothetical protein